MKIRPNYLSLLPLVGILALAACQSSPSLEAKGTDAEQEQLKAELAILKQKQQKYDAVVDEWQNMREGLQRLLVVEEELGLLIEQLDKMAMSEHNQTAKPNNDQAQASAAEGAEQRAPQNGPVASSTTSLPDAEKFRLESDLTPQYALQLTAVTSPTRLSSLWQDLSRKHPALLADLPANYQKITVKSTDYFRLKAGAFVTEQEATERCIALKTAGVGCIVSDYNNAPLKDISQ